MNIALYARVSTSDQSCEVQLSELRRYALERGWAVKREVVDVISGARAERPGLDELMGMVRGRQVDAVLCVKLDRMARSLVHFAQLAAEFCRWDVALICTTQGIDTSRNNPCGRFQMNVLAAVAEFERDLIRERTVAGLAAARERGKALGRPSARMPDEAGRTLVVEAWEGEGRPGGYRELGRRLGGVSGATAMRVVRKLGNNIAEPLHT